jgi:hypothetical protein
MFLFCEKAFGVGLTFAQFCGIRSMVIGSKLTDLELVEAYCWCLGIRIRRNCLFWFGFGRRWNAK